LLLSFAGHVDVLDEQNELWNIERKRRATRNLMLHLPSHDAIVLHPMISKKREDRYQEVLGALHRIKNKLRAGVKRSHQESSQLLWQSQQDRMKRSGFWKSVQKHVKVQKDSLMDIGPSLNGPPGEFALIPSPPQKATSPNHVQSSPEDLSLPKPIMSVDAELEARGKDTHFQKDVMRMMHWNQEKMKGLVELLNENKARIRQQLRDLDDLKEAVRAAKDKMAEVRRASKNDIEHKMNLKADEQGPAGSRGKMGKPGMPGIRTKYHFQLIPIPNFIFHVDL
jgi:hypothetical protein